MSTLGNRQSTVRDMRLCGAASTAPLAGETPRGSTNLHV